MNKVLPSPLLLVTIGLTCALFLLSSRSTAAASNAITRVNLKQMTSKVTGQETAFLLELITDRTITTGEEIAVYFTHAEKKKIASFDFLNAAFSSDSVKGSPIVNQNKKNILKILLSDTLAAGTHTINIRSVVNPEETTEDVAVTVTTEEPASTADVAQSEVIDITETGESKDQPVEESPEDEPSADEGNSSDGEPASDEETPESGNQNDDQPINTPTAPRALRVKKVKQHSVRLIWKEGKNSSTPQQYSVQVRKCKFDTKKQCQRAKHFIKKTKWKKYGSIQPNDQRIRQRKLVRHLRPATLYHWRVRAKNNVGTSPWAQWKRFQTIP